MEQFRIGILGAGNIAHSMANTINQMKEATLYAVSSRSLKKAEEFASQYQGCIPYGSYEDMLSDDMVDLVYVATPHSHHYEHSMLCIKHNKPVLCEKAFTATAWQLKELFTMAKEKQVFITEAIWTRYMPSRKIIEDLLKKDTIGTPYMLTANLGYLISDIERIKLPGLAGGALLDLGVYTINFARMFFGDEIAYVSSHAMLNEYGVDEQESITLTFKDDRIAVLCATTKALTDRQGIISGSNGYMIIENINNPQFIRIYNTNHELVQEYQVPEQITGYEYEVQACIRAIKEGKLECEEMPHEESIQVMKMMDGLRMEWGVHYPWDR